MILFGPPGSGKGTQARLIRECMGVPHISTGDMLRERMRAGDSLGVVIKRLLDEGELVTDDLVNQMVEERIVRPDCRKGFILMAIPERSDRRAPSAGSWRAGEPGGWWST